MSKNTIDNVHRNKHQKYFKSLVGATSVFALMAGVMPAFASDDKWDISIEAKMLDAAILELSAEADIFIFGAPELISNKRISSLRGRMTSQKALQMLLTGTGLEYDRKADGTYVITKKPVFQKISYNSDAYYEANMAVYEEDEESDNIEELEEITVVGSSIKISAEKLDMQAQPIELITDAQFKMTAGTSIVDYLQSEPVLTGTNSNPATSRNGTSTVNLRGAGASFTLATLNGRRFAGEGRADISAVPTVALENVQILKGGASAIYGSDALAGVVNFKLKENYEGVELSASYGDVTQGSGADYNVSALFGLVQDRLSFTGSIAYQKNNALSGVNRAIANTTDFRPWGGGGSKGPSRTIRGFVFIC